MKAVVLLNPAAVSVTARDDAEAIRRAFAAAGSEVEIRQVQTRYLEAETNKAVSSDADAVIAAGADGTLNTVANILAASAKSFGVLPLGMHNQFAKVLGIPPEVAAAAAALAGGTISQIVVPEVNGRIFLNYSTIGLSRWLAGPRLRLSARGHELNPGADSVIVCNHPDQMRVFGVENAAVPEAGLLNVYVGSPRRERVFRALVGGGTPQRFGVMGLSEVRVDAHRRHISVTLDGETLEMRPPLHYRLRAQPLRVLMPSPVSAED